MRVSIRHLLCALSVTPLVLTACVGFSVPGASQVSTPDNIRRNIPPAPVASATPAGEWVLFACADCNDGTLYFYHGDHPSNAFKSILVDNAFAVQVDDSENIYVSGGGRNSPVILTEFYARGGSFVYTDKIDNPTNVAPLAGGSSGFYAANGPQELFFPNQGIDRSDSLTDGNLSDILTTTVDSLGDVYLGGTSSHGAFEVDVMNLPGKPVKLRLNLTGKPVGLVLDPQGNLIVDEQFVGVAVFAPNKSSPIYWFDRVRPDSIALGHGGKRLYVLDKGNVFVYAYPAGNLLWSYSVQHSVSCCEAEIAIDPPLPTFDPTLLRTANSRFTYWTDIARAKR